MIRAIALALPLSGCALLERDPCAVWATASAAARVGLSLAGADDGALAQALIVERTAREAWCG